jgi:hypothetical protein
MEDTVTRNHNTGLESTSSGTGNLVDKAKEMGSRASGMVTDAVHRTKDAAGQYMDSEPKAHPREEHREGPIARAIEQQTARIPSDAFLWAAVGSMGLSLALEVMGEEKKANFVGHWAPTLLIFGLYNKLVKLQGSDGV